jgi:hypothetical protein
MSNYKKNSGKYLAAVKKLMLFLSIIILAVNSLHAETDPRLSDAIRRVAIAFNKNLEQKGGSVVRDKYSKIVEFKAENDRLIMVVIANKELYITDVAKIKNLSYQEMSKQLNTDEARLHRIRVGLISGFSMCESMFTPLLDAGAIIQYKTYFDDGTVFNSYSISKEFCSKRKK